MTKMTTVRERLEPQRLWATGRGAGQRGMGMEVFSRQSLVPQIRGCLDAVEPYGSRRERCERCSECAPEYSQHEWPIREEKGRGKRRQRSSRLGEGGGGERGIRGRA